MSSLIQVLPMQKLYNFFSKTTYVDFIDGKMPLISTSSGKLHSQSSFGLLFILQACSVHPVPLSFCHIFQTTLSYPIIELQAQVTCAQYYSNLFCCSPLMSSNMQHMHLMGDLEMHTTDQGRVPGRI